MACLSEHHKVLVNGEGKCSVPMWSGGCPAGFCDVVAYGPQEPTQMRAGSYGQGWRLALGSHDYNGGYTGDQAVAFHGGIETVANVLRAVVSGEHDLQIRAVEANGARKAK